MGRMGQQLIKSSKDDKNIKLTTLTENRLIKKKISGIKVNLNDDKAFRNVDLIIDFTVPECTFEVLKIASKSLNDNYLSKIFEVHHKHKKDYPSGTALMLGRGIADGKGKNLYNLIGKKFLNKKSFPYGKKINFNSLRKGEIIGEHEVKFSSGKEIITLNHEAFDRALYSDGALTAAKWLMKKKPGLYSMRDLLNFS